MLWQGGPPSIGMEVLQVRSGRGAEVIWKSEGAFREVKVRFDNGEEELFDQVTFRQQFTDPNRR